MIEEYITCPFCGLMSIFQYQAIQPDIMYECPRCNKKVTVLKGVIVPPPEVPTEQVLLPDPFHVGVNIVES